MRLAARAITVAGLALFACSTNNRSGSGSGSGGGSGGGDDGGDSVPPLGDGVPVTVAVNVVELPVPEVKDGLVLELIVVVVPLWVWFSVKTRLHPLMD